MIDKMDKSLAPTKAELISVIENDNKILMHDICEYLEAEIKAKESIDYSGCSMAPGWNLKYKKSGKSVCIFYPDKEKFTVLVTLNFDALEVFKVVAESFGSYIRDLENSVKICNGAKWLMINVDNPAVADDVKKLISLKQNLNK